MAMKRVLCIFRAACFSPGMVERDEAILRAVAARLDAAHYTVSLLREEELTASIPVPDIVLHMARSSYALDVLERWQAVGCRVLNPVEGIRCVEREALALRCAEQGVSTPCTWITDTADASPANITFPCWVKRTGACAQQPDDVCFTPDPTTYHDCIARFRARGISKAVVMQHLEGTTIKFYGVQGTDFLYCLPADKLGYDKWKGCVHSPEDDTSPYDAQALPGIADFAKLASSLHLTIYGGDAIIGHDGIARLIDLNDWPSFSACRDEAADAIVRLVKSTTL